MSSKVAIIPARGGSKRIPKKNIKEFLGKPIIAYSIETALACGLFDEVMVSTDSEEIAEIAKSFGANVPFRRSNENADDFATTLDVINEVLEAYEQLGKNWDYGCCIYPTAPFVTSGSISDGFELLGKQQFATVFPIVKFDYPIWRGLVKDDDRVRMKWPEHLNSRSQDLEAVYHDAGQWYWFNTKKLLIERKLFNDNSGYIELSPESVQDIDSPSDWTLAELKYKNINP